VNAQSGQASFASSGVQYDLATQRTSGSYRAGACDTAPPKADPSSDDTKTLTPQQMPRQPTNDSPVSNPFVLPTRWPAIEPAEDAGVGNPAPNDSAGRSAAPELAQPIGLVVRYRAMNTDPHDTVIAPVLRIENRAAELPVPLSSLELRYYFSNEHPDSCPAGCVIDSFYAGIQPTGQPVDAFRRAGLQGDTSYIAVTFATASPQLGVGQSVEVQQQFHTQPYMNLDETNDYSFDGTRTDFVEWTRVTLYRDGKLVWGEPPK
jgi:endoglucanase